MLETILIFTVLGVLCTLAGVFIIAFMTQPVWLYYKFRSYYIDLCKDGQVHNGIRIAFWVFEVLVTLLILIVCLKVMIPFVYDALYAVLQ